MHNLHLDKQKLLIVTDLLKELGFDEQISRLYTALWENGPLTLLDASRVTKIERTRLYRLAEELINRGLLEEVVDYKRRMVKAVGLDKIEMMVKEKELRAKNLWNVFESFSGMVKESQFQGMGEKVLFYRGVEGLKQMMWNLLSAKGLHRGYSCEYWQESVGTKFVERLSREFVVRKIHSRDLYSDEYINYIKTKPKLVGRWPNWESRYIPSKILTIDHNIDIFNEVIAYCSWHGEEVFGVEIYNEKMARLQKQIFDILWKMGKKTKWVDWPKTGK